MVEKQVRCAHILQKSTESRNPFDRARNKKITRSKEEALQKIKEIQKQLTGKGYKEFAAIAGEISECGSCQQGGDLGFFGRGQMQKPFEDASFQLKPGQMSDIVETDSGIHLIFRIE